MTDNFEWWQNALKGNRGPIHDGEPQSGFYRQRRKDKTYEPVAYWKDASGQRCHVNGRETDQQRALEMWPYVSKNPITAESYWQRMDTGTWADNDAAAGAAPDIDPEQDPVGSLKAEIAAAKAGIDAYKQIESDEASARAQTLRATLTGLSNKAAFIYESLNRPLLDQQKNIRAIWFPLRDAAADGANALRKAMGAWEDIKRENAKRAENRKIEAFLEGEQWSESQIQEMGQSHRPSSATINRIEPNTPPPATVIKGATGRAASVQIKKVVTAIDLLKAWEQFGGTPEVYNLLVELSQKAVDAGIPVPGATIEEKSNIR